MFRFIHAADVHLDSPLLNLDRYDGAPIEAFRSATRRAFDNMIALAIAERVNFVLIAGDLYDGDCADFNTPLHFRRKMEELREHDIGVYLLQGNHDAASKMKKAFRLEMPDNVHLFRTNKPETVTLEDVDVAIHGQGFAHQEVTDDLSAAYPDVVRGCFNIGMLHTSCGTYESHDTYAPSTVQSLTEKGYDFWALGHIHKRSQLAGPNPMIWYSGNLQGRHIREQGAKGCSLVTVEAGQPVKVRFAPVDVLRWQSCEVDATDCAAPDDVIEAIQNRLNIMLEDADGRPLAARVEVTGPSPAHRELCRYQDKLDAELRIETVDRFDEQVWVEKIRFRTEPAEAAYGELDGPLYDLVQSIDQLQVAEEVLGDVGGDLAKMRKLIPTDGRVADLGMDLDDEQQRAALLNEAKELLVSRLLGTGGSA